MSGRHTQGRRGYAVYLSVFAVLAVAAALLVHLVISDGPSRSAANDQPAPATSSSDPAPSSPALTSAPPTSTSSTAKKRSSPASSMASPMTRLAPNSSLRRLIAAAASGSVSVTAVDLTTGRSVNVGANKGMLTASLAKVQLLETLLLRHQEQHTTLSDTENSEAIEMIEHSDNTAANEIFYAAGGRSSIISHESTLGLSTAVTIPGSSDLWGLTTTSASQQVSLLRNLVESSSPLDAASRSYALNLMRHVESDQRWGVPVTADPQTSYAVKNGWLSVTADGGLWAVNSDGIITAHGDKLLVTVMTQHNRDFDGGIALAEQLARAAVATVT